MDRGKYFEIGLERTCSLLMRKMPWVFLPNTDWHFPLFPSEGVHAQYRGKRYSTPRGRVELNNGIPTISVGTSCPDLAIHEVKKSMGLLHFPRVDVRRASFWDGKSTGDQ